MDYYDRIDYEMDLDTNGIHTISGYLPGKLEVPTEMQAWIRRYNYQPRQDRTFILLNPNKFPCNYNDNGQRLINKYSQFEEVQEVIFGQLGYHVEDFEYLRADFAFNSHNIQSFERYSKLHKLVICCVAQSLGMKNCYHSQDLFTFDDLSFAVKNDAYQLENYDKWKESGGNQQYCNRLEIRSVRLSGNDLKGQLLEQWTKIFNDAKKSFEQVQQVYNQNLAKIWLADQERSKKRRKFMTFSGFCLVYQDAIFTRRQLIDLCKKIGYKNSYVAEDKADKLRDLHTIDCFTRTDIDFVCELLRHKMAKYLKN